MLEHTLHTPETAASKDGDLRRPLPCLFIKRGREHCACRLDRPGGERPECYAGQQQRCQAE